MGAQSVKLSGAPGACTYSIHTCSLGVLRLTLSNFYLIRAIPFVIFGLVKGGGRGQGEGRPPPPFPL